MKNAHSLMSIASIALVSIAFAAGCSSARPVEVTGEIKAAASVTLTGPISVEFFEVTDETEDAEPAAIKKIELAQAGEFSETVDVEGDAIRIFALDDADKDGACDEGEAWAEIEAAVKEDGTVEPVTLELSAAACPVATPPAE